MGHSSTDPMGLERSTEITKGSGSCVASRRSRGCFTGLRSHYITFQETLNFAMVYPPKKYSEALCGAWPSRSAGFQKWISCWLGVTQHARSVSSRNLPWLTIKSIIFGLRVRKYSLQHYTWALGSLVHLASCKKSQVLTGLPTPNVSDLRTSIGIKPSGLLGFQRFSSSCFLANLHPLSTYAQAVLLMKPIFHATGIVFAWAFNLDQSDTSRANVSHIRNKPKIRGSSC